MSAPFLVARQMPKPQLPLTLLHVGRVLSRKVATASFATWQKCRPYDRRRGDDTHAKMEESHDHGRGSKTSNSTWLFNRDVARVEELCDGAE